jgi:hypothetical protein
MESTVRSLGELRDAIQSLIEEAELRASEIFARLQRSTVEVGMHTIQGGISHAK